MIRDVRVIRPKTLQEALKVRADLLLQGKPIAGGTDLLVELRKRPMPGLTLIDLTRLEELRGIRHEPDGLWIGALTSHEEIAQAQIVKERATALAQACSEVGSVQIRNRGTIGGNVANASPCADGLTALVGLGAWTDVISVRGSRRVSVEDLVKGPYEVALGPDEIILGFFVPLQQGNSAFLKLGRREALAIARINAACVVEVSDGLISHCMIAAGSVMPKTQRVREAEAALLGKPATVESAQAAGDIVAQRMVEVSGVRWSTPYKDPAVRTVIRRVLVRAMGLRDV